MILAGAGPGVPQETETSVKSQATKDHECRSHVKLSKTSASVRIDRIRISQVDNQIGFY